METKQSQIKINLSTNLKKMIEKRASKYGLTLAGFAKYLFVKDLEESEDLDFSTETWKNIREAKGGKGKFIKVENTKKYFDKLCAKLKE